MRFSWQVYNPIKHCRLGWEYKSSEYPSINMQTWEPDGQLKVWIFEVSLVFISLAWGSVDKKVKPKNNLVRIK